MSLENQNLHFPD